MMRISENIAPHEVIESIAEFMRDFAGNPTVRKIIDGAGSLIYDYLPSGAIVILIASLLICLCGRKLLPLLKVLLFFGVGYVASAALIAPPNAESFGVIMHVTLGAVAAALSRPLYFVTYVTASGGAAFLWVYSGALISSAADNAYIALLAALIAIILVLYFRAYVEMLATSILGALGIVCAAELLLPEGVLVTPVRILTILSLAVIGFIRQTRVKK